MTTFFDINGTRMPISEIKDFRIIDTEFIFRPAYHEVKKSMINAIKGKKFEFDSMQPYAAIIGQQGQKSALGEYNPKTFKEALGKDISGAVIYTLADKLKLKAFKHQKYQCINLAGRAFTTYLDDIPVMLTWNDGRIAEVFKEDPLYTSLEGSTTPGIQYISTLVIKTDEVFCFYGNGIQIADARMEYERLKKEIDDYYFAKRANKAIERRDRLALPSLPKLRLPAKIVKRDNIENIQDTLE